MKYKVYYSAEAKQDLKDIVENISFELLAPEAAINQTRRILKVIESLMNFPMRYSLYRDIPWNSAGLRFVSVDNYIVFYLINEITKSVSVVRIMYSGRDISKELSEIY